MKYLGVHYRIVSRLHEGKTRYYIQEPKGLWGWGDVAVFQNQSYITGEWTDSPKRVNPSTSLYHSLQDTDMNRLEKRYRNMRSAEHYYWEAEKRRLAYGTRVEKS